MRTGFCLHMCLAVCLEAGRGHPSSGTRVTGIYELPDVAVGNQTSITWTSNRAFSIVLYLDVPKQSRKQKAEY